jgi:hypothetical protein
MYELGSGQVPALAIGPYRAIAWFRSGPANDPTHDHLYVLYARAEELVLEGGRPAAPLEALPLPKGK